MLREKQQNRKLHSLGTRQAKKMTGSFSMQELSGYCINADNILGFGIVEFDGATLRTIEEKCMTMGANCAGQESKFRELSQQVDQLVQELTVDRDKRNSLIRYVNHLLRQARNYAAFNEQK